MIDEIVKFISVILIVIRYSLKIQLSVIAIFAFQILC
jgi:hypothetical protein